MIKEAVLKLTPSVSVLGAASFVVCFTCSCLFFSLPSAPHALFL